MSVRGRARGAVLLVNNCGPFDYAQKHKTHTSTTFIVDVLVDDIRQSCCILTQYAGDICTYGINK